MFKILHYVPSFSPLSETFIYDLVSGLEARGECENVVVCKRRLLIDQRPFEPVVVLKKTGTIRQLFNKISDSARMRIHEDEHFRTILSEFKPDMIHAHFGISGIRVNNFIAQHQIDIPLVVSFHGSDILLNPAQIKSFQPNLLKINANERVMMTTPSQFLKDKCLSLGLAGDKIKVVNNTVNEKFLGMERASAWDGKQKLKIVILGRLAPMKGHKYVFKALAQLKQSFDNFELHILGDGPSRDELNALAAELNLQRHIVFHGAVAHADLPRRLSGFHLSITSSVRTEEGYDESFCISLIEASMAGLYCIASDAGGPAEVLTGKEAFTYPQKDYAALTEKILACVNDPEKMALQADELREFMLARYHPEQYFCRYISLYKNMIDGAQNNSSASSL